MYGMLRRTRLWRTIAGLVILFITIGVFVDYFASHPAVRAQLRETPFGLLAVILLLYLAFVGALALVNSGTLRLCRTTLSGRESLLLTMYSSIINFFGPLQSGPAFRALYLKQKHGIKLRDYTAASFVYYFFYALFSGVFLFSGLLGWWLLITGFALLFAWQVVRRSQQPELRGMRQLLRGNWYLLAAATLLQVCALAAIYYVELQAVQPGISLGQVIIYTGAANFALFVSLTPGAIGFRESFLVFSQQLHGIETGTIVAANTIDRAIYIVLLLILALIIFGTHAQRRFEKP